MKVVGLMSGTSCDGIDAALVEIRGGRGRLKIEPIAFHIFPYTRSLQKRLIALASNLPQPIASVCHLNFLLGECFADAVIRLSASAKVPLSDIALVGSHGQTLHHLPKPKREGKWSVRSTLQLGEASIIAERTGITTLADFRTRDMAAGGEGAPLTPYLHYHLLSHPKKSRGIINIGGISNITYLKAGAALDQTLAFDMGPGNMLIDAIVSDLTKSRRGMDRNGAMAKRGHVHPALLAQWMRHPFLRRKPPKSTGRETFGSDFVEEMIRQSRRMKLSPNDLVATATAYTTEAILKNIKSFVRPSGPLDEIIVGGGGVKNPALMTFLQKALAPLPVRSYEQVGYDSRAIEAIAFAILAYQSWHHRPTNIPSVTGARHPVILGKIVPGNLPFR